MADNLRNKALDIAQRYCGMTPKDLGVETYAQMQEKMANELMAFGNLFKRTALILDPDIMHEIISMKENIGTIGLHNFKVPDYKVPDYPLLDQPRPFLIDSMKLKTDELLGKTKKLQSEVDEMEEQGTRGKTNNRKIKVRKNAKNGKKRK